jgi:hypothetical protein
MFFCGADILETLKFSRKLAAAFQYLVVRLIGKSVYTALPATQLTIPED